MPGPGATEAGTRTWHAYLSMPGAVDREIVNARDRIGHDPWYNARGELMARNVDELHGDNNIDRQTALTEQGQPVSPDEHDILTGSREDGMAFLDAADRTCRNWTSSGEGSAQVGHHDRRGDNTSWNSAHPSSGCGQQDLVDTGGSGLLYCFAIN